MALLTQSHRITFFLSFFCCFSVFVVLSCIDRVRVTSRFDCAETRLDYYTRAPLSVISDTSPPPLKKKTKVNRRNLNKSAATRRWGDTKSFVWFDIGDISNP